jgi:hypothetical protein
MSHFTATIRAYDCLETIQFIVHVRDYDSPEDLLGTEAAFMVGTLPGRGSAEPTRWLRELLEGIREHM